MIYTSNFKQSDCDISLGEAIFLSLFQFGLWSDRNVKNLLLKPSLPIIKPVTKSHKKQWPSFTQWFKVEWNSHHGTKWKTFLKDW
jgi:hypothetical protein